MPNEPPAANAAGEGEPSRLLPWADRHLPHYLTAPPSHMHAWLDERLSRLTRGERLAVIAPRDSAKSTFLSFAWPLFRALAGSEPYILLVAETAVQARRYLRSIKQELEGNASLLAAYKHAAGRGDPWNIDRITLNSGVEIEALGTGASIRGRKNRQHRPSLVIVDDPQDRKHIASPTRRAGQWTWFTQDLLNVGAVHTNYLVAGTSLHREALVDRLFQQPGWEARRFPAIEREPTNLDLWEQWERIYTDHDNPGRIAAARAFFDERRLAMEAGAAVCWPSRESLYALMKLRVDIGRGAFAAEKQGTPLNPDLCEWPLSHFGDAIWFERWPADLRVRTLALDPSKGRDARLGDYSAFVLLGLAADNLLYVEADLARRPIEQIVQDGVELYRRFQPQAFGCEANAWQDLLAADFEREFRRQGLLAARPRLAENRLPKLARIRTLGSFLSDRRFRFKSQSAGTQLLVQQLKDFPLGDHDDGPDALEMALRLANNLCGGKSDGLGGRLWRE